VSLKWQRDCCDFKKSKTPLKTHDPLIEIAYGLTKKSIDIN